MIRVFWVVYDASGRRIGSFRTRWAAESAIPPSERWRFKILREFEEA